MDATRPRRTRDEARRLWYGRWRQERFARSAFRPGDHQKAPPGGGQAIDAAAQMATRKVLMEGAWKDRVALT
jgi:hypothetical protein